MLTFAEDGLPTAEAITKIFRSKQPRIGVLILQEQEKGVYSRAEEFIDDCFKQVIEFLLIELRLYVQLKSENIFICFKSQKLLLILTVVLHF